MVNGQLKFLTQNTQLLPAPDTPGLPNLMKIAGLCQAKDERIPCIIDLIVAGKYDIVGLQEVWDDKAQNEIVRAWHANHKLKTIGVNLKGEILTQKQSVTNRILKFGQIIDARPNKKNAEIVYDKYFVMGPDQKESKFWVKYSSSFVMEVELKGQFKITGKDGKILLDATMELQDGGLLICTGGKYPIIAASGFIFNRAAPLDIANPRSLDFASNKGALYARIQVGLSEENYIHVFNTHLQAQNYPDASNARSYQLKELGTFIEKATSDKNGKNDGRPIVLLGDFNIIAGLAEYRKLLKALPQIVDVWQEKKPKSPGYTWTGKNQKTKDSPWGDLGNVLACETGKPQRIDYFFYNKGSSKLSKLILKPKSISLVPSKPDTLYCLDPQKPPCTCKKISAKDKKCKLKSHTVSDHLGVEMTYGLVSYQFNYGT